MAETLGQQRIMLGIGELIHSACTECFCADAIHMRLTVALSAIDICGALFGSCNVEVTAGL